MPQGLNPEALADFYSVNAALDLVAFAIAATLVLTRSPRAFGASKWAFVNVLAWGLALDLHLTVLYRPLALFPAMVVCGRMGLFGFFHGHLLTGLVPMELLFLLLFGSLVSVTIAFWVLLASTHPHAGPWTWWHFLLIAAAHVLSPAPLMYFLWMIMQNYGPLEEYYAQMYPDLGPLLASRTCVGTSFRLDRTAALLVLALMGTTGFWSLASLFLWTRCIAALAHLRQRNAVRRVRTHGHLLTVVAVLFLIPLGTLVFPVVVGLLVILGPGGSDMAKNVDGLLVISSMRTLFNAIAITAFTRTYRHNFRTCLRKGHHFFQRILRQSQLDEKHC